MKSTLKQILDREGILVLDGSMGTALENLGADLNNKLWTARVLADRPELVKAVHIQYFRAGADAGITCSYQASLPGLMETGYSREQAEALITRAVQVFLDAPPGMVGRRREAGRPVLAALSGQCRPIRGLFGRWVRI